MNAEIPASLADERIDRVVAMLCGLTRGQAAGLVAAGAVHLDGRPVIVRSRRVATGDLIDVISPEPTASVELTGDPEVSFKVVYADSDLVVIDKPAGLVVHPGPGHSHQTLVHGLLARFPEMAVVGPFDRPGIVHRLDAGTSGLMVAARSHKAYSSFVGQLAERQMGRQYLALVNDHFAAPSGEIDAPVGRSGRRRTAMAVTSGGRPARTGYQVRVQYHQPRPLALVECRLMSGRTHQIRVHLAAIGHSVVGDTTYGRRSGDGDLLARPFLHAWRLSFQHPTSGAAMVFESDLPGDLEALLCSLECENAKDGMK